MAFRNVRAGIYSWGVPAEIIGDEEWLHSPEKFVADDSRLLKIPGLNAGTRVVRLNHRGTNLVLKEYRSATPAAFVKILFRGPAALRSLHTCARLMDLGLPAIEAVCAGYRVGAPWHSFLVTREIAAITPFKEYYRGPMQAHAVASAASLLGRLHAANLLHGDAHLANFAVVHTSGKPVVTMVDVDGVRACREVTLRLAARDISRLLDYSRPTEWQMKRFALVYSRCRGGEVSARALLHFMRRHYHSGPVNKL